MYNKRNCIKKNILIPNSTQGKLKGRNGDYPSSAYCEGTSEHVGIGYAYQGTVCLADLTAIEIAMYQGGHLRDKAVPAIPSRS